jgi:cobalt-zinc-cadmium efflux system protein
MLWTGWDWLDPAVAILVSLAIAVTAAGLFREALHLSLDGVPEQVDPTAVAAWLGGQESVRDVHDLHIWPISTTRTALAVHVVVAAQDTDAVLHDLSEGLAQMFGIAHSTIQLEREPCGASCHQTGA